MTKNGETGFSCVSPRNNRGTWKCCRERANVDLVGMGKKEMCQFQDGVVQKASQTGPWLSCRHSSKPGFSTGISHSPTAWDSSGAYHCSRVPELNLQMRGGPSLKSEPRRFWVCGSGRDMQVSSTSQSTHNCMKTQHNQTTACCLGTH
jgi:hypothetical protein